MCKVDRSLSLVINLSHSKAIYALFLPLDVSTFIWLLHQKVSQELFNFSFFLSFFLDEKKHAVHYNH